MILNRIASRLGNNDQSVSADSLSRRSFLQAGAAVGGGLMLSLRLPFANGDGEAIGAKSSCPTPSSASTAMARSC